MHSLADSKAQGNRLYFMELSRRECIELLEKIRWGGEPQCPYCGSRRASPMDKGLRHHCNDCFTSYSVTVGTIFHKTHVDLQKWFRTIELLAQQPQNITVRALANTIEVSKDTAASMLNRIKTLKREDPNFLKEICLALEKRNNKDN
ncbi:transposase [Nodosilinea sp. AN01ver1]|uniref:transposase n=1 Tax=Nodosilinea sp. AN01ver1 TaxID=3423362 RepID=UPI003D31D028